MSLRKKTLLLISLTLVGLILLLYLAVHVILTDSFMRLEVQDAAQNVQRAQSMLDGELADLRAVAWNWANRGDTYYFIEYANQAYIDTSFTDSTFEVYRLNLVLLVNTSGEAVFAEAFDLDAREAVPVPRSISENLTTDGLLLDPLGDRSNVTGILMLPGGPMLVTAQPIRDGGTLASSRGTLILGRFLLADRLEHVDTQERVTFAAYSGAENDMDFTTAQTELGQTTPLFIQPLNHQAVAGYTLVNDIYGNPGIILRVEIPRSIYHQGQTSLAYLLLSLVVVGMVSGILTLLLLERVVLSRMIKLTANVSRIGTSADLSTRLAVVGTDELSSLASSINTMLEALHRSQGNLHELNTQLEERVADRTAEVEKKNALLQAILDTMGEGVIYTTDRHIFYANKALADMTGYAVEELIGQPDTLLQSETARSEQAWLITARLSDSELQRGEMAFRRKDQTRLTVAVTATPLAEPGSEEFGRVAIVRDITKEKELEEWQARFISSASHELRTPMTNFTTRLYLMRNQPEKAEEHLEVLEYIANRMKRLIEDLLDVSRFQQGTIPVERQDVILQSLVTEVVRVQQPEAERKRISLHMDFCATPRHVYADPTRILQAVTNLVTNAILYTPEGGTITVQLLAENEVSSAWALIRVRDTGAGIAPEHLPKVFQPFYRATRGGNGGTGLGLTITREIVELHGGTITVESEVGKGSTFTLKLPMLEESVTLIPQIFG
jgi:PAS domain S-box-containing protein